MQINTLGYFWFLESQSVNLCISMAIQRECVLCLRQAVLSFRFTISYFCQKQQIEDPCDNNNKACLNFHSCAIFRVKIRIVIGIRNSPLTCYYGYGRSSIF